MLNFVKFPAISYQWGKRINIACNSTTWYACN